MKTLKVEAVYPMAYETIRRSGRLRRGEAGDPRGPWRPRRPRVAQDAPELDRVVSVVTICAKRHALFGLTLPVVSTRSGRGPRFVVVQLPDGRTRSLLRSITDLEMEHSSAGQDSPEQSLRVSVRTLLPLARLLAARSPSQEGTGDDGADRSGPAVQLGADARAPRHDEAPASGVAEPPASHSGPTCLDAGRDGSAHGGGRYQGAR